MMIPIPQYVPMLSHFSIIAVVIHLIFAGEVALNWTLSQKTKLDSHTNMSDFWFKQLLEIGPTEGQKHSR